MTAPAGLDLSSLPSGLPGMLVALHWKTCRAWPALWIAISVCRYPLAQACLASHALWNTPRRLLALRCFESVIFATKPTKGPTHKSHHTSPSKGADAVRVKDLTTPDTSRNQRKRPDTQ